MQIGSDDPIPIVSAIHDLRDGLVGQIDSGVLDGGSLSVGDPRTARIYRTPVVTSDTEYDQRRRPVHMSAYRKHRVSAVDPELRPAETCDGVSIACPPT